ncbi:uncharacterized protein TRIVIDRAFT_60469 [Trichoderma virens Gv29-8]|uniref:Uncharacterized protein n=1 Tax=Hypocrea virens (strain Gv29-8 / FGSC 10586) TaxID=413071 RepID=G9MRG7_HYPVG|nr:uncharacterized protein TRIVIDRAFT_60469 [Trichoderma virens Gv29-8]EHK22689.1 hypothetical protein TRIVIDRAFT_60469 [Trichoderma virens Gv29-8]UKZ47742.1 hypothetical protein TrVGV298_001968 [Trichoderma virens]
METRRITSTGPRHTGTTSVSCTENGVVLAAKWAPPPGPTIPNPETFLRVFGTADDFLANGNTLFVEVGKRDQHRKQESVANHTLGQRGCKTAAEHMQRYYLLPKKPKLINVHVHGTMTLPR